MIYYFAPIFLAMFTALIVTLSFSTIRNYLTNIILISKGYSSDNIFRGSFLSTHISMMVVSNFVLWDVIIELENKFRKSLKFSITYVALFFSFYTVFEIYKILITQRNLRKLNEGIENLINVEQKIKDLILSSNKVISSKGEISRGILFGINLGLIHIYSKINPTIANYLWSFAIVLLIYSIRKSIIQAKKYSHKNNHSPPSRR